MKYQINKMTTCCFWGHRTIKETEKLKTKLREAIEYLIITKNVDTFLFGSKSEFNHLCLHIVSELKIKYPHIKRIYVRAEFPYIDQTYEDYLLQFYDDTYYPQSILGAGKAVYIKRNYEMINHSQYGIIYFNENYTPPRKTTGKLIHRDSASGTKIAYRYAQKQNMDIINIYETI